MYADLDTKIAAFLYERSGKGGILIHQWRKHINELTKVTDFRCNFAAFKRNNNKNCNQP